MGHKILVVDDEDGVRRLIGRVLRQAGHEILEALDGRDIFKTIRTQRPDLILLDVHMPQLDGIEALSEIREIEPRIPVIIMTGDGNSERAQLAMERGACDYLTKPIDMDYMLSSVTAHLLIQSKEGR
ncbi:MAG: response regulator [Elusimicrobia bacterium]|nr:response regulator [Elusimicrobiota bacterium]